MSKLTQQEKVIRHLKLHGTLSQNEAMTQYGISRLASRINDLKNAGWPIHKRMLTGQNRYGEKTRYARYALES